MIKNRIHTTATGRGKHKELLAHVKQTNGASVTVGFHQDAPTYPDGTSVIAVALHNEFGTSAIPERSFIRSAVHENTPLINRFRQTGLKDVAQGVSVAHALAALGFKIAELIKNKIKSNVPPPNAPSTQARKRRLGLPQRTLIETSRMLESVTYQVEAGKSNPA